MKKRIFLTGILYVACLASSMAQTLVNGDFSVNCGTNSIAVGSCSTFFSGCVDNWQVSHGAPQLIPTGPVRIFINGGDGGKGQGILGGYGFCEDDDYEI